MGIQAELDKLSMLLGRLGHAETTNLLGDNAERSSYTQSLQMWRQKLTIIDDRIPCRSCNYVLKL